MPRQRKQSGYIYQRAGWWILRYREDVYQSGQLVRKQLAKQLQPVAPEHRRLKRPPASVAKLAESFLAPLNNQSATSDSTRSLAGFVDAFYLPHVKEHMRVSTYNGYRSVWKYHLEPRCGQMRLRDFRTLDGEQLLQTIARQTKLAKETLKQIKSLLSAVFKRARQLGFIDTPNPMRDVSIPNAPAHSRQTGAYTLEEELQMLKVLPEPARSIVAVAAFSGLRRGELRGLEWRHYVEDEIQVMQSIYQGITTAPKSEASRAPVPVIAPLKKLLDEHWVRSGRPADGYIFPSRNSKSLSLNNVVNRQIEPALKAANVQWKGWHGFRRGLATNLHALGVDDLTIQRILRHSNVATTQKCYIKTLPEQSVAGMHRLELALGEIPGLVQ
jgi:integrase